MSNFFVALYAVLPMFIVLAIGFTVRKMKVIEEAHLPVLNKIVFNVFFPFLMFNNIYAFDLSADFNASLLLYAVVAVAVIYGLSVGFALIFEKSNKSRGALIQAIYRSNFVLMGLPIVGNIFGSGRLGMTSMLVTVIVPMYNILAVITLEVFRGESIKITKILKGIVTNPLIIGSVAGILFAVFGIKLPEIAESVISDMASAATPLALIVLGASFEFASIKRYKKNQRHKTAGFFNLQKYSLLQLRQMNPQEHQHVRHKLARRGARFMRRGIPPRQGAVKRNVLLLPRLVDGRANRAFYRQRRRAVSPRNGWVDFHRHAARLNGLTQEIHNRIQQIVEAGQTRRHAERRQQTGNFPLRRDLRFRQGQLRRLRAGGCSGRRHGRHGLCGLNGSRCLCALHRFAKRDERNCLRYRESVHLRRH